MAIIPLHANQGPRTWHCQIGRVKRKCWDNVLRVSVSTCLDVPPSRVLAGALEANMTKVVVAGYDEHGEEYFASSASDGGDVIWLLERAKRALLNVASNGSP